MLECSKRYNKNSLSIARVTCQKHKYQAFASASTRNIYYYGLATYNSANYVFLLRLERRLFSKVFLQQSFVIALDAIRNVFVRRRRFKRYQVKLVKRLVNVESQCTMLFNGYFELFLCAVKFLCKDLRYVKGINSSSRMCRVSSLCFTLFCFCCVYDFVYLFFRQFCQYLIYAIDFPPKCDDEVSQRAKVDSLSHPFLSSTLDYLSQNVRIRVLYAFLVWLQKCAYSAVCVGVLDNVQSLVLDDSVKRTYQPEILHKKASNRLGKESIYNFQRLVSIIAFIVLQYNGNDTVVQENVAKNTIRQVFVVDAK